MEKKTYNPPQLRFLTVRSEYYFLATANGGINDWTIDDETVNF